MATKREMPETPTELKRCHPSLKRYRAPRIEKLSVASTANGGNPGNKENGHFSFGSPA